MPVHLRPSAPTAPDALLCGDPSRALAIAQRVLVKPRMSNHHRGLWGYHGHTRAGAELTVQATGIGGPSAAVVLTELAGLGLQRAVRIGTCSAPSATPAVGTGLVVERALTADGTTAALGFARGSLLEASPELFASLRRASGAGPITVVSRDVDLPEGARSGAENDAQVGDLQTAATFAVCRGHGIVAGAVLAVARSAGRRLEDEPLESVLLALADAAAVALATTQTL